MVREAHGLGIIGEQQAFRAAVDFLQHTDARAKLLIDLVSVLGSLC